MDGKRGLGSTPIQPRLQGLGGGLGAGTVASRQASAHLKTGPPATLSGSCPRPGSLGSASGTRLGSTTFGGLGTALPLRSVARTGLDASCSPPAAATSDAPAAPRAAGALVAASAADANGHGPARPSPAGAYPPGVPYGETTNGPTPVHPAHRVSDGGAGLPNGCAENPDRCQATTQTLLTAQPLQTGQAAVPAPGNFRRLATLSNFGNAGGGPFLGGPSQPGSQPQPWRGKSVPAHVGLLGLSAASPGVGIASSRIRPGGAAVAGALPLRSLLTGAVAGGDGV
jgi:hypothetical protein